MRIFTQCKKVMLAFGLFVAGVSITDAQSYLQTCPLDTIVKNNDTLEMFFVAPQPNAYGNATLTVFYEGDFGDPSEELMIYGENWSLLGYSGNSASNNDCNPGFDSAFISIPSSMINSWGAAGDTIKLYAITTPNVDFFCTTNHVKGRLTYNYCLSPNAQVANFVMSATSFCSIDGQIALTATPAGGTFTGTGVTGSVFDAAAVAAGSYTITYTVTDTTGCTSSMSQTVSVGTSAMVTGATTICEGTGSTLSASGSEYMVWYSDAALTNAIDTTFANTSFNTGNLTQTTNYYVGLYDTVNIYSVTAMADTGYFVTDHDAFTGDDRSGIAVSSNYVYIVGDNNTARYDLNLTPASVVSYPVRDGIFSNLADGKLYTMYDGVSDPTGGTFNFTQIVEMNADLTLSTNVITLSQPITVSNNNNYTGIFSGHNILIIFNGDDNHWYAVNLRNGNVEDLGYLANPEFYGSENWAVWGVAEFDGTNYSVLFNHSNWSEIHRRVLPAQASTAAFTFSNLSDMACFTVANNRWYFHYEGSGQFGGSSETIGFAYADDTSNFTTAVSHECAREVVVTVEPAVNASQVADTVCLQDGSFALTGAIPAGGVYSGNGVAAGNFDPSSAGVGAHNIVYTYTGTCSGSDTASILVDVCAGLSEVEISVVAQPNPTSGQFSVRGMWNGNSDVQIQLISVDGRVISTVQPNINAGEFSTSLDLSGFADGIYYLRVFAANQQSVIKLVKQN